MPKSITPLLKEVSQAGASDLYITVDAPPTMNLHGELQALAKQVLTNTQVKEIIWSITNKKQQQSIVDNSEANFAIHDKVSGRFRVNVFQQRGQYGMVLRRIESKIPTFQELNLPEIMQATVMEKRGLIIVVGPTSSGKSTSLAAMVGYRNQNTSGHILCVEDPIEYVHAHDQCIITQREVGVDTESFEVALKNGLRQAPTVILIGEIRTRATMELAINFAETGHLCLATLHANNANQAIDRIINFFPEDRHRQLLMDLSLNLRAVFAQQLLKRVDGGPRCVVIERLLNTPRVSDLILKGDIPEIKEVMKKSTEQGMRTFDQALFVLFKEKQITEETALKHADSANDLRLMIKLDAEGDSAGDKPQAVDSDADKESEQNKEDDGDLGDVSILK